MSNGLRARTIRIPIKGNGGSRAIVSTNNMDMPIPDQVPSELKLAGDIINAPKELIDKIASFLPRETSGIVIQISNMTCLTLALKTTDFSSGGLEPSVLPAPIVGPFSQTVFGVRATSAAPGVIGSVTYEGEGLDALLCGFNNPLGGRGDANVSLNGSLAKSLGCFAAIEGGHHAAANFVLFRTDGKQRIPDPGLFNKAAGRAKK